MTEHTALQDFVPFRALLFGVSGPVQVFSDEWMKHDEQPEKARKSSVSQAAARI